MPDLLSVISSRPVSALTPDSAYRFEHGSRTFTTPLRFWDLPDGRRVRVTQEEYTRLQESTKPAPKG